MHPVTESPRHQGWQHALRQRVIELACFVPPAIFMGGLIHIRQLRNSLESSLPVWILDSFVFWLFWWLVLPLLRRLTVYWSSAGKLTTRQIGYHALLSIPLGFLNMAMSVYGSILIFGEDPGWNHFVNEYVPTALRFLPLTMLIYAAIIGMLSVAMIRLRLRAEEERAARLREESMQARLQVLQGQIHPHFLFNTLNSLDVLIRSGNPDDASQLLHRLATLLRTSLQSSASPLHSCADELQIVETYLAIEQLRFSDRLTIARDIDPHIASWPVPKFCIQTLVENAMRHGIARKSGPGVLGIRIGAIESLLQIQISDSGPGVSELTTASHQPGTGLENLRSRLGLIYASSTSLLTSERRGDLTIFTLRLPARSPENHAT